MARDPVYVQVRLRSTSGQVLTCWLDKSHKFKEGSIISLRGETERYEVVRKYHTKRPKSQLNKDWRVGGLV